MVYSENIPCALEKNVYAVVGYGITYIFIALIWVVLNLLFLYFRLLRVLSITDSRVYKVSNYYYRSSSSPFNSVSFSFILFAGLLLGV